MAWKKRLNSFKKKNPKENAESEIRRLNEQCAEFDSSTTAHFKDFPLSKKTFEGLQIAGFTSPTEIQKECIGLALKGFDILGAAKTGSGKTLAFLIPVLEKLYKIRWSGHDGLGALVVTPTRELAYQIFEVLRQVGQKQDFSAGLIIGGKDLKFERKRVDQCNIVIGTPGRLLQHLEETAMFTCDNLQILILDEADRILDMGFQQTMNSIISYLPQERQTLLFSATQTKSVKDLARLSLKNPVYVSIHEHSKHSTPEALQQHYLVCKLEDKVNLLWSFIKSHLKQKILVFMTCGKQVQYLYQAFCRLRPGMTILALYGTMHQLRRMAVYDDFHKKQSAVLFATDIAARGLDFPSVNWVLQMDRPEDTNSYIHRVGRTARFEKDGQSLLVLSPSEEDEMTRQLGSRNIPIEKIKINPKRQHNVSKKLQLLLTRDVALKESAQRAFKAYLKAMHLMKKKISHDQVELDLFAQSLGLTQAPRVRFLAKSIKQQEESMDINRPQKSEESATERSIRGLSAQDSEDEDDDDLFIAKANYLPVEEPVELISNKPTAMSKISRASVAAKAFKRKLKPNSKITFDEDGGVVLDPSKHQLSEAASKLMSESSVGGIDINIAKAVMMEEDRMDKELYKRRIKEMRKKQKLKEKRTKREMSPEETGVALGGGSEDEYYDPDEYVEKDEDSSEEELVKDKMGAMKKRKLPDDEFELESKIKRRKGKTTVEERTDQLSKDEELALRLLNAY